MEEKSSLVQISTKSWHFIFMKFVLGKLAPTPENMFNLCPYFWLFIFSVLFAIPIVIVKYVIKFFKYIFDGLDWTITKKFIEPSANSWYEKLTDLDVYQIWNYNKDIKKIYKIMYEDDYNNINKDSFVIDWYEKKYKKKAWNENISKDGLYTESFKKWLAQNKEEYDDLKYERSQSSTLFEDKMSDIREDVNDWFADLGNEITSWKTLIKWTKRIVGVIVTGTGLFVTYFVVNFLSRGILFLVEHWDWHIFGMFILYLVGVILALLLIFLMVFWIELIKEKGLKLWYARMVYYPFYWIIYTPLKFIIYYVLWHFIALNTWALIKGGAKLIWGSFLGFLGIFGEYFGASYTDYCPGIEWKKE